MVPVVGYEHVTIVVELDVFGIIKQSIFNRTITKGTAAGSIEPFESACSIRITEVEYRNSLSVGGRSIGVKCYVQKPGFGRVDSLSVL